MQVANAEVKGYYKGGFPKEVKRNKYNLAISERLKAARSRTGLSAAGVVKKLSDRGVSIGQSTLQGYEAPENSMTHRYPSLPVLIELAGFYECSIDYLLGITDRFRPNEGKREQDIKDLLEGRFAIMYNGVKLNSKQREFLITHLNTVIAEVF